MTRTFCSVCRRPAGLFGLVVHLHVARDPSGRIVGGAVFCAGSGLAPMPTGATVEERGER